MFWVLGFLLFNSIFSQRGVCESEIQTISKVEQPKLLKFNTTNNILLKGEINEETTSKFIYDLNLISNKNNTVVYLNTPGGSVQHGMKIVSEVEKYNLSCVAEAAYKYTYSKCPLVSNYIKKEKNKNDNSDYFFIPLI